MTCKDSTSTPKVHLGDLVIDPQLVKSIPEKFIRRHRVVPLRREGHQLTVAMVDPLNVVAIDDLRLATGCEIEPVLAAARDIEAVIQQHFGLPGLGNAAEEMPESELSRSAVVSLEPGEQPEGEAPVIQLAHSIILQAIRDEASDIHIEHQEEQVLVRSRVDGLLSEIITLPRKFRSPLVSRFKIMAGLDIAEKRLPQDGRIQIRHGEQDIDLRVSTMPTVFGEKVVIRILDKSRMIRDIDELGFTGENLQRLRRMLRQPHGIVLITGPTGSGKTTTLYAILNAIKAPELNLITLEDPVEYILPGVNQIQVQPRIGLTFARGLRSLLRQDPDIIMVGEIRDAETAESAVRAAGTGHLVFSTLHTNDAVAALFRLVDLGVEPFMVASTVLGVVGQRLVRVVCPHCRESYPLKPGITDQLTLPPGLEGAGVFYRGRGCAQCGGRGYRGRTVIAEVLPLSAKIRQMLGEGASAVELQRQALAEGMQPIMQDGLAKARQGITAISEVMRVAFAD